MAGNEMRHPETGGLLLHDVRDVAFVIGGETVTLTLAGWFCARTGRGLFVGRDLAAYDQAVRLAKAAA